jgi:hypothetical protein
MMPRSTGPVGVIRTRWRPTVLPSPDPLDIALALGLTAVKGWY